MKRSRDPHTLAVMPSKPVVYSYAGCGTCRKALAWLAANGVECEVKAIRETPPTKAELDGALAQGLLLKSLFNVSGGDYKELNLKDKLPGMPQAESVALLASRGNLVKRPFVKMDGKFLTGFSEESFAAFFADRRRA